MTTWSLRVMPGCCREGLEPLRAHLHVVLGHLSNDRLLRMVSLAGGNNDLLCGVQNMRCQICSMVRI